LFADRTMAVAKGGQNMRSQSTIKRLNMYRGGKPIRYVFHSFSETKKSCVVFMW